MHVVLRHDGQWRGSLLLLRGLARAVGGETRQALVLELAGSSRRDRVGETWGGDEEGVMPGAGARELFRARQGRGAETGSRSQVKERARCLWPGHV